MARRLASDVKRDERHENPNENKTNVKEFDRKNKWNEPHGKHGEDLKAKLVRSTSTKSTFLERFYLVGSQMVFFPDENDQLTNDQSEEKDEDHFHVHGFVSFVFLAHHLMSNSKTFLRAQPIQFDCLNRGGSLRILPQIDDQTLFPKITVFPARSLSKAIGSDRIGRGEEEDAFALQPV